MKLFLISLFGFLFSISMMGFSRNPNILSFNRLDYNAGNKNWAISEDSYGVFYFANDLGLLEFDGIKWYLNKTTNNNVIRSVLAVSNDIVFTGGYEEFGVWKRDETGKLQYNRLSSQVLKSSLHNTDIWRIIEQDGSIFFQSFNAIFVYTNGHVSQYPINCNVLLLNKVYNELWIQEMGGGILKLNKNTFTEVANSDIFSSTEVKSILPFENNKYLIGTGSMGIYLYDGKTFMPWLIDESIKKANINCGVYSKSGSYFYGTTSDGVYEISVKGEILNHFSIDNYLPNNTVLSMFEDKLGNIWVGLDRGISCITYIDGVSCYTDPFGKISSVYAASIFHNKLYIGTNRGVYYIDIDDLFNIDAINEFRHLYQTDGQIWDLLVIDDKLYCAHNQGVYVLDSSMQISSPYSINTGVFTVRRGSSNSLLLGTYTGLVNVNLENNEISRIENLDEPINKIERDHTSNIWLQHMNRGIYRIQEIDNKFQTNVVEYINDKSNLDNIIPYNFQLFKIGGRIAMLGRDTFFTYNDINNEVVLEQKLNDAFIDISNLKSIRNITPYRFWIIEDKLLYNVKYEDKKAVINSVISIDYDNFSLVDNYETIIPLNDSLSLLCLDRGFLLCSNNPPRINEITSPYIKSICVSNIDNDLIYISKENFAKINNSYNTITFYFSAKDVFNKYVKFQYRLLGSSDKWKNIDEDKNSITFERLIKGNYIFQMRTINQYGSCSEIISYDFEVLSTWYQSTWAYIIYLILILIIVILFYKYKLSLYKKKIIKDKKRLEAENMKLANQQLKQEVQTKNAELLFQTSSIVLRNQLIIRIKKELNTFQEKYTNKNFIPLFQKINTLLNNSLDADEDWYSFLMKFEQKHPAFFKYLKNTYPDLTSNDLRLCACLKLNLDSKDIASLMNISVRSVENARSRLRKKLGLNTTDSLSDFIISI